MCGMSVFSSVLFEQYFWLTQGLHSDVPTGIRWKPPGWLFPPWMLRVVYIMALMLLAGCFAVTVLYTSSLSEYGFFLWLISCICALLSSALFLEPLKVGGQWWGSGLGSPFFLSSHVLSQTQNLGSQVMKLVLYCKGMTAGPIWKDGNCDSYL